MTEANAENESGDQVTKNVDKMMDDVKALSDPKNWTVGKIITGLIGLLLLTTFIVLTVYLGQYAFSNPDPSSCWITKGVDAAALTKDAAILKAKEASVDVPEGYPVEMHRVFVAWAMWGFLQNAVMITVIALTIILVAFVPIMPTIASVTGMGWCIGTILWLVFGAIWRYSFGGGVSSGDRLVRDDDISDDKWKATLEAS